MPGPTDIFDGQMDYIFFIHGFALVLLAGICATLRHEAIPRLPWAWLGLFGLFHGIHEWLEMLTLGQGQEMIIFVRLGTMALSYLCLVEFGRVSHCRLRGKGPGRWIHLPLVFGALCGGLGGIGGANAAIRCGLGITGGLWSALALWNAAKKEQHSSQLLSTGAAVMAAYAIATGLTAPKATLLPATLIHGDSFPAMMGCLIQMVRATLVIGIVIVLWTISQRNRRDAFTELEKKRQRAHGRGLAIVTCLVLAGGWGFTQQAGRAADQEIRRGILQQARIGAAAIRAESLQNLTATPSDLTHPDYQRMRQELQAMKLPAEDSRLLYLMVQQGDKIVFSVDSDPVGDPLHAEPGVQYLEPPKALAEVFRTGQPSVVGPYKDEWGTFVSGFAPIMNPATGKPVSVLGIDMEARRWERSLAGHRVAPISITLLIATLSIGYFVVRQRTVDSSKLMALNELHMIEAQHIAHLGSWDWNVADDQIAWSEETRRIMGRPGELGSISLAGLLQMIHPDDREMVRTTLEQNIKTREPFSIEHRVVLPDGTQRVVLQRGQVRQGSEGRSIRLLGTTQDITERKQMEMALRESEARFRALFENSPPAILIYRNATITYTNPTFLRMFGYNDLDSIRGHPLTDVFAPEERELIRARGIRREQGMSEPSAYESLAQRRDGGIFPVHISVTRLDLPDGPATVGFFMDVTERKQAEADLQRHRDNLEERVRERTMELTNANRALKEEVVERWRTEELLRRSEERMRLFFERQLVGMAITSPEKEWLQVNDKMCYMLGYSREELNNLTWSELTYPQDLPMSLSFYDKLAKGEIEGYTVEQRFLRKNKSLVHVSLAVGCVRNEDLTLDYVLVLAEDITDRKRSEVELKKLLSELERSNKELEQFAYVASHDLQEPLRLVSAYTQLLLQRYRDKLDAGADPMVKFITDGVSRMHQLIQDLLAYSRVSSQSKPFAQAEAQKIFESCLRILSITIRENKARITHDPLPWLACDQVQLGQLFQNLIGNAIKFHGPETPRIHVGARKTEDGKSWLFSVQDNGIGIEPEFHERIFIIFQRLHSRAKYSGTGIGLAICKRVVERHGGRIWVESQLGQGATFFFTIPLNPENT